MHYCSLFYFLNCCVLSVMSDWLDDLYLFRYFLSARVVQIGVPCSCLLTLFNSGLPIPALISTCITLPSLLSPPPPPPLSFPCFSFHLPSLTPSCHPCYPLILSSVSLYSYPSCLISSVFLSAVMLSSLPSYPPCLISSHFPLVLSSVSPSVSLVTFVMTYQTLFCLNSVQNVTFKNLQATVARWVL